ncbi:unnamed protein product [Blepharisma stoltei]|uniref:Oxidation resistance protein 1 n=1 Tax=Blepharisma stoltei TaxID=1481888 RepID=A0AAU9IF86_9CILI|nr:unnamed protein product [Blepharisma stoltei]
MEFERYTVKPGDSLVSISSSLRMTIEDLCQINQLEEEEDIFPGMVLKVQTSDFKSLSVEEYEDKAEETEIASSVKRLSLEQTLFSIDSRNDYTVEAVYCTADGDVMGDLGVSHDKVVFCPLSNNDRCEVIANTRKYSAAASQFRLCIAIRDIATCSVLELPSLNALNPEDKVKNFFVQFVITKTGKEKKDISTNIPKANVYFKISDMGPNGQYSYFEQKVNADELAGLVKARQELEKLSPMHRCKTFVPYYDLNKSYQQYVESGLKGSIFEQANEEEKYQDLNLEIEEFQVETRKSIRFSVIPDEGDILPELSRPSEILNESMVKQITKNMGMLFQIRNWHLSYSFTVHGTSYEVFFRLLEGAGPSVVVIEDSDHHIFGGFASHQWKPSKVFYGTGDCFLFTFHTSRRIQCFFPTLENDYYMNSDSDGISMGSGGKTGLYIDRNFVHGSSGPCKTYANEILSGREYFNIVKLEFWALV